MQNKSQITNSENKIKKDIYRFPILISLIALISISFIIYNSIEYFKVQQTAELRKKLIENEKKYSKNQIIQISQRIDDIKKTTESELKRAIKSRIYEANNIIQNIIKENKGKSKEELKKLVSIALAPIRFFEGRGYYLVYDKDTKKSVIHPVKRFIGKDMSKFKDKKNQLLVNLYDKTIKKTGEGYADIYFVKPKSKDNKEYKKVVFVKSIPELNWVIGTGDYFDDVEKKIQKQLLQRIESLRFGNNGYYWIHNTQHKLLMHPFRQKSIGINDTNLEDSKGTKIIQLFVNKAKNTESGSFVEYYWKKPNENEFYKKISYVKHIKEWDWVIGAGVYLDDIEKLISLEKKSYESAILNLYSKIALLVLIILVVTLFLSINLSRKIQKEFTKYSKKLTNVNNYLEEEVFKRTKELNDLNHSLEDRVREETEKSRLQEIQLLEQSKFAQMGEMIGNIAHQWRQPLSLISTISSGLKLKSEFNQLDKTELSKDLNAVLKTTNHLSETIDHFRDFIKEKRTLKHIIIQNRIKEVLTIVDTTMQNNHIKIIAQLNEYDPIEIEIVLGELSQVLINLLNNSKDAIIINKIDNAFIKISCVRTEKNIAQISIEDNAGGIDKNIISKIFDPYFTTKHQSQGTGIGLYMSKNIIEKRLQGKLLVKNINDGVRFTIEIPL